MWKIPSFRGGEGRFVGKICKIGMDKSGECGIICISAGVLLLWRFNEIKTKRSAEISTKRGRKQ